MEIAPEGRGSSHGVHEPSAFARSRSAFHFRDAGRGGGRASVPTWRPNHFVFTRGGTKTRSFDPPPDEARIRLDNPANCPLRSNVWFRPVGQIKSLRSQTDGGPPGPTVFRAFLKCSATNVRV